MDTSEQTRVLVVLLGFGLACLIVYANLAIFARQLWARMGKSRPLPRRRRLARAIWHALGLIVVLSVYSAFWREPDAVKLYRVNLRTAKLRHGAKIRIVQLSDFHLVGYGKREARTIKLVRNVKPDLILLTGDYRNSYDRKGADALGRVARELHSIAPVYFVSGNWDVDGESKILKRSGAAPMECCTRRISIHGDKIVLVGLGWYHIRSMPGFQGVEDSRLFHIVLAHTCDGFKTAARHGIDLYLCGHTHGGQARLPIFGAVLPDRRLVAKYQAGLYRLGKSCLYVNRGLGMEGGGLNVRFCCRPEVTVIELSGLRD